MSKKITLAILVALAAILGVALWQKNDGVETGKILTKKNAAVSAAQETETVELKNGDRYDLTMSPVEKTIDGKKYAMVAYNGSIPGPVLRVPQGAEITVNVKNDSNMATTLHAHGVRMTNAFDGVPGLTQKEVAPGESFAYTLSFPDAGAFWYHPHVRTDYALESGLYGSIIVTPKETGYWAPANRELSLMLDDIAVDKNGIVPFDEKTADHTLMGRFGNVMLVNGETDYALSAMKGEVVRLYLTNAANTRLFNFVLPGAKMKLVGADSGRYIMETWADEVLLAPGERRVVDVLFDRTGTYEMKHQTPGKAYALGTVTVSDGVVTPDHSKAFATLRTNASEREAVGKLTNDYLNQAPAKTLRLALDMNQEMQGMMQGNSGHMGGGHMMGNGMMMSGSSMEDHEEKYEWEDTMAAMNARSNASMMKWQVIDAKTKQANTDIKDWKFALGDKVKIRILNDPNSMHPMQHPIHFHGQNFLVLATNGVKNENPVWTDTALIASGDTVDILLDASNKGMWMAHCHILEHAESGMMLMYEVE